MFIRKTVELGYFIAEEYWGRGIATEAVRQMVSYVSEKEFDIVRIYAEVFEYNKASMESIGKNGFYLECIRKRGAFKNNVVLDDHVWVKIVMSSVSQVETGHALSQTAWAVFIITFSKLL